MPVKVIAGCSARPRTCCGRAGGVDVEAVAAGGVHDELPGLPRAAGAAGRPRAASASSGTASRTSSAGATTSSGSSTGTAGQQLRGPGEGGVADGRHGDDAVARPGERRAQHGADPTGADHADVEACRTLVGRCHADNLSRTHRRTLPGPR